MVVVEETNEEIDVTLSDSEALDGEEQLDEETQETEELSPEDYLTKLKESETALEAEREKNKSLYEKFKKGQKKGIETRKSLNTEFVSKDDVRATIAEMRKEEKAEAEFRTKYDDANELMPELTKLMEVDGLSLEKAYFITKGRLASDDGYRNQLLWERSQSHWTHIVAKTTENKRMEEILSDAPSIAQKRA